MFRSGGGDVSIKGDSVAATASAGRDMWGGHVTSAAELFSRLASSDRNLNWVGNSLPDGSSFEDFFSETEHILIDDNLE